MRSSNATVCIGKPPPPWFWLPYLVFKERRYAATLLSLKEWPQPRFCCEVDSASIKLCHRVIKLYEVRNVPNLDFSYVVEKGAILLTRPWEKRELWSTHEKSIFWSLASVLKTTGYSMVTLAKTGFICPYQAGFCSSSLLQSNSDFNKRHKQWTKNHVVDVVLCETKMFSIVVWPMKVRGEYSILVI